MQKVLFILCAVILLSGRTLAQPVPDLAPGLLSGDHMIVMVEVADSAAFLRWTRTQPKLEVKHIRDKFFRVSSRDGKLLQRLISSKTVSHVDRADRKAKEETVLGDFDMTANAVYAAHGLYPGLRGDSLILSVKEKPFDIDDLDLRGRIVSSMHFDEPATAHATFIATIAAGAGNTSPYAKGAAWGAGITTSDFQQLLPDLGSELEALNVSVQNHSYGVGVENYYGIEAREYDAAATAFPKILHVFSSGNDGDLTPATGAYSGVTGFANLTGQFKVSKNTIAVGTSDRHGNVAPRSSRGPAHDGRVKPEVIAFGDAGSSEAAAVVSGIALQLQEAYRNIHDELPDAALVKAVLVNSAKDAGRPHVDFETGFGNVHALQAIRTITAGNFWSAQVQHGTDTAFAVTVPDGARELKVTLAWADPPAEAFASDALVNDLDIEVRNATTSDVWQPWVLDHTPSLAALQEVAQRKADHINNIEQVTIVDPAAGVYEIFVRGYDVPQGPQHFFVAYEIGSGFEWTTPSANTTIRSNSTAVLRWQSNIVESSGVVEYRMVPSGTWLTLDTVDLAQSYYDWATPDTSGLFQLRLVTASATFYSEMFPVSSPFRLDIGFNCEEEVMFIWPHVPAASQYILYSLGQKYLEPVMVTEDTFVIIDKENFLTPYFSVAPGFQGLAGQREFTINYHQQGVGCYFIAFLPKTFIVTDDAVFDVILGTTHKLVSATLERSKGDEFEVIQAINAIEKPELTFTDLNPVPGSGHYRVRLVVDGGSEIFSDTTEVFYVRANDLYLYPNPAAEGDEVNIITSDEGESVFELLDVQGRPVRFDSDFGSMKIIDTSGLPKGVYILKVHRTGGTLLTRLIIV